MIACYCGASSARQKIDNEIEWDYRRERQAAEIAEANGRRLYRDRARPRRHRVVPGNSVVAVSR